MIKYQFSYKKPHNHFIDISLKVKTKGEKSILFQLPAWRPGRYELADFAKNIQKWNAFDDNGNKLPHKKITKDLWKVDCNDVKELTIYYNYYANVLDAGSSYLDHNQLYVNPVNCCMYVVGRENEKYSIELDIPKDFQIACGIKQNNNTIVADNFDTLAESPFIASNSMQYISYKVKEVTYHIWIQGTCKPKLEKLSADFKAFTIEQVNSFGSFPVDDYHFLFQITPYRSYHGVEHTNSTVILIGDIEDVFENQYDNILGICSHELYHTWNIKAIRPKEMLPYDYSKENYSKLGYVAEGVTTYMGDLMLKRSGVFNWQQFIKTQDENLKRHYENDGRYNLSVADSGFDSWLDGYTLGIPNRKTSIYADGALNMMMIDLYIIEHSNGKYSLNEVMKRLYNDYLIIGYTEDNFQQLCIEYGGLKVYEVFRNHIYGIEDYTNSLKSALKVVGFELLKVNNPNLSADKFGFISTLENGKNMIKKVQNNSVADNNGIAVDDELICINDIETKGKKINDLLNDITGTVSFKIKKRFGIKKVDLKCGHFYPIYKLQKLANADEKQLLYRAIWAK